MYLGSRNLEKGATAVQEIKAGLPADCAGDIECVLIDTSNDTSVTAAATAVKGLLGDGTLYAFVNNVRAQCWGCSGGSYGVLRTTGNDIACVLPSGSPRRYPRFRRLLAGRHRLGTRR